MHKNLRKTLAAITLLPLLLSCSSGSIKLPQQRKVDALWYSIDKDKKAKGGTSEVTMVVDKNNDTDLKLGFYETEVEGTGQMWRASAWMGTSVAAFLTKKNINQYKIDFTTKGRIDGPSAGALLTIAMLSALQETELNNKVAMTGTINPDGTIGPVGGILNKLQGAKDKGKTIVLVPISQRYDTNVENGESVDVVKKGEELGLTVKEVSNIYDAYKEFTGKELPRPEKGAKEPELPSRTYDRLKLKTNEWKTRYDELAAKVNSYNKTITSNFTQNIDESLGDMAKADSWAKQGSVAAAYNKTVEATLKISIVNSAIEIAMAIVNKGQEGIVQYVNSTFFSSKQVENLADRLAIEEMTSFNDLIAVSEAYSNYGTSLGVKDKAQQLINEMYAAKTTDEKTNKAIEAALYFMISKYSTILAEDALDFGKGEAGPKVPDSKNLLAWSNILRRSAEANQNYFDATVLDNYASQSGQNLTTLKYSLASNDFDYLQSVISTTVIENVQKNLKDDTHKAVAAFGLGLNGFTESSGIIAKYYSLDASVDKNGSVRSYSREKALTNMLENAIELAKENIESAKKAGATPSIAIYHYQAGKTYREGSMDDKLSALVEFWKASMYARLSTILLEKK